MRTLLSQGVGNTMALPLDGRSLRFSGPSLTVVNDLHGFPRYSSACPVRSFFLLVVRFVATDSWPIADHRRSY